MFTLPLGLLGQTYAMFAAAGLGYMVVTVVMGQLTDGGDGELSGSGDDGGVGDDGGASSDDGGIGDAGGANTAATHSIGALIPNAHKRGSLAQRAGYFLLSLLSPLAISCFCAGFGLFGLMLAMSCSWLGVLTLIPAILAGICCTAGMKAWFRWFIKHSFVSTHAVASDLPGNLAEVNIPIPSGRMGEVTYVVRAKRLSSSARCEGDLDLKKGTRVMITRVQDNVVFVEPCD